MTKLLITAGCSFSVPEGTWVDALRKNMNVKSIDLGVHACSNGVISKLTMYNVTEALKTHNPDEILVGVMWSGANRSEFYSRNPVEHYGWWNNPVAVADERNYWLINSHWDNIRCKEYYKYFYDIVGSVIKTIEHILNVQWFLKSLGVPYFMAEYHRDVFERNDYIDYDNACKTIEVIQHPDIKYLYDLIDFGQWVDAENCLEWITKYSNLPFPRENDPHPSYEQHKVYVEQVIIPFLKRKQLWQLERKQ